MKTNPVFESYLANINTKTGKTRADFKALAKKKGLLRPGVQGRRNRGLVKEGLRSRSWPRDGDLCRTEARHRQSEVVCALPYPGLCPRGPIHHSRMDRHRPRSSNRRTKILSNSRSSSAFEASLK